MRCALRLVYERGKSKRDQQLLSKGHRYICGERKPLMAVTTPGEEMERPHGIEAPQCT